MTPEEIKSCVLDALLAIAPEADASSIAPTVPLRDQLDLDSFDFLNVVIALHKALEVEIPESDYARLATLDGAVAYLTEQLARPKGPATAPQPGGAP